MRSSISALCLLCAVLVAPSNVSARGSVLLEEIIPALSGSPLGAVEVAPAPPPGGRVVVRRSDVLRVLAQAGAPTRGLAVPSRTIVRRERVAIDEETLQARAQSAAQQAAGPCRVLEVQLQNAPRVSSEDFALEVELAGEWRESGKARGVLIVHDAGRDTHVPLLAQLQCPPPEVEPGRQLTLVVRVGNVTARAPGEARQQGRTGDVIRVLNRATHASLRARVLDAQTAEVLP